MQQDERTTFSKREAFTRVIIVYLIATLAAIITGYYAGQQGAQLLVVVGVADLVATVVVFLFSYYYNNSSFYDPYWSVIPILIALFFTFTGWENGGSHVRIILLNILVGVWGIRLTYNWARGWRGLEHQDWRYDQLERQTGSWYWIVSFFGIHLFPTVLVFLGCLALYPTMVLPGLPINVLDLLAVIVTAGAIFVEALADEQLRRFVRTNKQPGKTLTSGLWAYSRHPNYLGETSFWWGLYIFVLAARPDYWWMVIGPVAMVLLFRFISIPMIDKRMMERRTDYAEVVKRIPGFLPISIFKK